MRIAVIKPNIYRDSVNLMLIADQIRRMPGVVDVAILMGTPANKRHLLAARFDPQELAAAGPGDLCIGLETGDTEAAAEARATIEAFLRGEAKPALRPSKLARGRPAPRTLDSALRALSGANLAVISLPGEYAGLEARKSLERGLHVFLFSNNVTLAEEQELKTLARSKGLLLMGPDCGTALICGTPLGFCNIVDRGSVGLVAASGTGAQEVMSLLAEQGVGISHVLGTGGRDVEDVIGGVGCETALRVLQQDASTAVIVLVAKPPAPAVAAKLLHLAQQSPKPVVMAFVGPWEAASNSSVVMAMHLAHAAQVAAAMAQGAPLPTPATYADFAAAHGEMLGQARGLLAPGQKYVRGLFTGGTLADEAALLLADVLPAVQAGAGFKNVRPIRDWTQSSGHMVIDLGEDRFTQSRPHPMIDPSIRLERLRQEGQDPAVAVILIDVILGLNAHPNPAAVLAPAIEEVRAQAARQGRALLVVAHVCGTSRDPQNLDVQREKLQAAGCHVFNSNAEAAWAAAWLIHDRQ